nr:hypothetical protein [Tanacetum cinerariifolium]
MVCVIKHIPVSQCDGVGLESVEARLVVYQQNENVFEEDIKLLKLDVMLRDNALVELRKKFKKAKKERDEFKQTLEKFQTSSKKSNFESDDSVPTSPVHDSETVLNVFHVEPSTTKLNKDMSQSNRPSASVIKDWVSDSEDKSEGEPIPTQKAPSFVQTSEHVKTPRTSVKSVERPTQAENLRKDIPKSRGVIDSGCSRHMTGNISYLSDFKEINEGVPRDNNMYNVDLKNIVPSGDLTCLFANATLDESNLWHRRLENGNNVNDLIESALNSKLLLINLNSQRLKKEQQEVKNVVEQPTERGNCSIQSLQKFRVIHKSSISFKNTSQISLIHAVAPILSTKEPEHSLSMRYDHLSITLETEYDEIIKSGVENILPIPSECEVTSEDESECDVLDKDNCSPAFTTFSNPLFNDNDDLDSSDDESLPDEDVPTEEFKDGDSKREEINIVTETDDVLPPGVENDDSDGEVDAVDDLRVDNSISNSEHESSESEDFDFDNPSIPLPPPEPPDEEFDFEIDFGVEISAVKNTIVEFECIDARVKFDVSNDENVIILISCLLRMKGIKREFSVARTPQHNGVEERKNRTLIEAARTMLADLLLPIPFWAEAVNTACYVQNRVLVTKPHNKTPYKLLVSRTPSIGFMRPFGCPVTILNTLDPLGKFDGKADEGFLVGYSVLSKAFRVFNSKVVKEPESAQQYVLLFLWSTGSKDPQNSDADAAFDVKDNEPEVHVSPSSSDKPNKHDEKAKRKAKGKSHVDFAPVTAVGLNLTNTTNSFNTAGPSDNVTLFSDNEEDVGVEADFSNLETSITVSLIPTTRVHKDHPVTQIISDLTSAPQTRSMAMMVKEQGGMNQINNDDFHTYMFACFLSQEEPKRVHQPLKDPSWIEAMQEEILQFKMQKGHTQEEGIDYEDVFAPVERIESIRLFLAYASFMGFMVYQMNVKSAFLYETIKEEVYVCQPLGFEDPDYPDKVYKVVKALYGLHQSPRAWYETLAKYLLENGFQRGKIDQTLFIKKQKGDILLIQVYVDDIIFRSTNKELRKAFEKLMKDKFQMSSMGELTFLGLQVKQKDDGIFISQYKYVAKILRKFGLIDGKSASIPIDTEKPLLKDPDDIMYAVCACARFQVTPKVSHLHAVKRIFRYLKGKPHLGLWYPIDSPFNLVAYSDSDYAGDSIDRKSTTGGCQFLCCRLISWQCKKQTVVATSSTEAEYVAAASCCAQVL